MDAHDQYAEWVARWRIAAPRLAAIRSAELRQVDVARFIGSMEDAFRAAQAAAAPRPTSGLIIQQQLFARLHP
jgi:hypothetical protein